MKRTVIAALVVALVTACSGDQDASSTNTGTEAPAIAGAPFLHGLADRLVGEWSDVLETDATVFNEHWQRAGGTRMTGTGFVLSGNDTVSIEYLDIERTDSGTFYSARIPSQNNGRPVRFRQTSTTGDSLVFEAPEHDFPQRIVYVPLANGRWDVRVSGPGASGTRVMRFQFERSEEAAHHP